MEGVLEIFKGVLHLPPEEVGRGGHLLLLLIMGNLEEGQLLRLMAMEQE